MSTLITHIYNEEFLLPYFINHHKEMFDQVYVIDYQSTDKSIEILKDLAPHWKILSAPTQSFDPIQLDRFIMKLEESVVGPRIALTVTEFLLGDPTLAREQIIIPSVSLVNMGEDVPFISGKPFHEQRSFGIMGIVSAASDLLPQNSDAPGYLNTSFLGRKKTGRSIHCFPISYDTGRHFEVGVDSAFLIYRVSNCFVTEQMFDRRLQIQDKLDKNNGKEFHVHHSNFGQILTREDLVELEKFERSHAKNFSRFIDGKVLLQEFSTGVRLGRLPTREQVTSALNLLINLQSGFSSSDISTRRLLDLFDDRDLGILFDLPKLSARGKGILLFQLKILRQFTKIVRKLKQIG